MILNDALLRVGEQLGINGFLLQAYAAEDTISCYDETGDTSHMPYKADAKFLYALIRALKPRHVLEIGTNQGGSARHILEAISCNKQGHLTCVDIDTNSTLTHIPMPLRMKGQAILVYSEVEKWLKGQIEHTQRHGAKLDFDFIHEDGAHSIHTVQAVYQLLPDIMPKGGVIVSHDIGTGVGNDIRLGMAKAGYTNVPGYLYEGSPCGFSVLKYEGIK